MPLPMSKNTKATNLDYLIDTCRRFFLDIFLSEFHWQGPNLLKIQNREFVLNVILFFLKINISFISSEM